MLIRNLAGLAFLQERAPQTQLVGDFSLNVANELTAEFFFREKLARLVPSYDLNWDQLLGMLRRSDPAISKSSCISTCQCSTWSIACSRPCCRMARTGAIAAGRATARSRSPRPHRREFPLTADTGCRNTVFNATPQSAAEFIPRMQSARLRHFRLEFLRESAEAVALAERSLGCWREWKPAATPGGSCRCSINSA